MEKKEWGYLRETKAAALKAVEKSKNSQHFSGLEEYLAVIFPDIKEDEWIHDKKVPTIEDRSRPDYRCEKLKLIIEFDGVQHYQNPYTIKKDREKDKKYKDAGYEVIRIPYFIQLTNEIVKQLFGKDNMQLLFDSSKPSISIRWKNTPAYCCPEGVRRMAQEFKKYPQQYEVNMKTLEEDNDEDLTGISFLKEEYEN